MPEAGDWFAPSRTETVAIRPRGGNQARRATKFVESLGSTRLLPILGRAVSCRVASIFVSVRAFLWRLFAAIRQRKRPDVASTPGLDVFQVGPKS
jgi:hypothetical protein